MSFECVEAVGALSTKLKGYSTDRQASATGDPPQAKPHILPSNTSTPYSSHLTLCIIIAFCRT